MININDKLIREDLAKIGVDALAVLLCITTHFNKFRVAWPGVERLRAMTALSKERTYNAIRKLQESGYIERWQENKDGKFGKTKYRLTTDYIGIYMGVSAFEMEELPLAGIPEHGIPEHGKPYYGNTEHLSINEKEGINEIKLINEREGSAPAPKNDFDIFAPDAHEKTAAYLIAYLEENAHLIPSEMREVNLRIPKSEGEHYKWIGRRIAGMQSWHQVAAKFDKQDAAANGAAQYTTPSAVLPASVPRPQQRTAPDSAALKALKESQNRLGL
jgi:hypothetical protein